MHLVEKFVLIGGSSTVSRNGDLVNLCLGPHIQNTKADISLQDHEQQLCLLSYGSGQRFSAACLRCGISTSRANERIGDLFERGKSSGNRKAAEAFLVQPTLSWILFLVPHSIRIFNAIQTMLGDQYWELGYDEVHPPLMTDVELWKTLGPLEKLPR